MSKDFEKLTNEKTQKVNLDDFGKVEAIRDFPEQEGGSGISCWIGSC